MVPVVRLEGNVMFAIIFAYHSVKNSLFAHMRRSLQESNWKLDTLWFYCLNCEWPRLLVNGISQSGWVISGEWNWTRFGFLALERRIFATKPSEVSTARINSENHCIEAKQSMFFPTTKTICITWSMYSCTNSHQGSRIKATAVIRNMNEKLLRFNKLYLRQEKWHKCE